MPTYITVTTTANTIRVSFNDISSNPDIDSIGATFQRSSLKEVWHNESSDSVVVHMDTGRAFELSCANLAITDTLLITSIDTNDGSGAQVPTTQAELHDLLEELIIS